MYLIQDCIVSSLDDNKFKYQKNINRRATQAHSNYDCLLVIPNGQTFG